MENAGFEKYIDQNEIYILNYLNILNMFDLKIASLNKEVQELISKNYLLKEISIINPEIENGDYSFFNNFKDFPNISEDILVRLEAIGIKNTIQLYEEVLTPACRLEFSIKTGIDIDKVLILTQLADVSRIKYVNCILALTLLKAGYTSSEKVSNAEPIKLYNNAKKIIDEKNILEFSLRVNQFKLIIDSAKTLSFDIEYD